MQFIKKYDNYLSHEACDYIVNILNTRKDLLYEGTTTGGKRKDLKVSKDLNLIDIKDDPILSNEVLPAMRAGITKALLHYNREHAIVPNHMKLVDIDNKTLLEVLKHHMILDGDAALCHVWKKKEGHYNWHMDLGPSITASARVLVCMYYLNDVTEGGETEFYYQNIESKPTKGSLMLFPADWTHLHRGKPPISNTKYICNFWLLRKNPLVEKLSIKQKWKQYETNI